MVTLLLGNGLYGVVNLVLNGLDETGAFLVKFAFGTEILLFEFGSLFLFFYDGLLALFLLRFGEEDHLVLIVLVELLCLIVECLNFGLPSAGGLVELLVGTLVSGNVLEDILHIHQCKLLGGGAERTAAKHKEENEFFHGCCILSKQVNK